jgi:signal transduction histidine kinase
MQVRDVLELIATSGADHQAALVADTGEASDTLDSWDQEAEVFPEKPVRDQSTALVDKLTDTYAGVQRAIGKATAAISAHDAAGAIAYVESTTGPAPQTTLTATINKEVAGQQSEMKKDASVISTTGRDSTWAVGIVGGLLLIIALGGTLMVSRRVVGPVVQLRDAARDFGEGGSALSVDVKSRDELGDLARTFNEMAVARASAEEDLRKARDELEDRVEERTSELAMANEELARLNGELVSINKELNDFAYIVSHDLKAPLRGIGSLATWLSTDYQDVLDESGRRQLELLLERAMRMETLIESVLQYSRVGRLRESRERIDLNELVESAIKMIDVPDNVTVTVDGKLPEVQGERTRLGQVFQNLIGNAVKFMDKPQGEVAVSCADDGRFWKLSVADNGPGIDAKYFDQIFQIFQTLSARDDVESSGVGLTLVKKIVEMHGGRVWVTSEVEKGATFFFTLPKEE